MSENDDAVKELVSELTDTIITDSDPFYTKRSETVMLAFTPAEYMYLMGLAVQENQSIQNWIRVHLGFAPTFDSQNRVSKGSGIGKATTDTAVVAQRVVTTVNKIVKGL